MKITSYAQNFEDVMLWRALQNVECGFYIDIGANDPLVDSVSLAFYERGWRGLHVEPMPSYAKSLREMRPDEIVIEAAVGVDQGFIDFYEIPGGGLSTADKEIAERHRSQGINIREIAVPCIPLSAIFAACNGKEIHWLKIDVEGFEQQVLSSWGASTARPWIILAESTLPLTQIETHGTWESIVINYGYEPVYFDGLNRFYISDAHPELRGAFRSPPNVFDGFCLDGSSSATFHNLIIARHKAELTKTEEEFDQQRQLAANEVGRLRLDLASARQNCVQLGSELDQHLHTAQDAMREVEQGNLERERKLYEQITVVRQEMDEVLRGHVKRQEETIGELLCFQKNVATNQAEQLRIQYEREQELQLEFKKRQSASEQIFHRLEEDRVNRDAAYAKYDEGVKQSLLIERNALKTLLEEQATTMKTQLSAMQVDFDQRLRLHKGASEELQKALKGLETEITKIRNRSFLKPTWLWDRLLKRPSDLQYPQIKRTDGLEPVLSIPAVEHIADPSNDSNIQETLLNKDILEGNSMQADEFDQEMQRKPTIAATSLEVLAGYQDHQFIECAYRTLLRRAPDNSGLKYYLQRLRAGTSKMDIVIQFLDSKEGRIVNAELPGLRGAVRRQKLSRMPLFGGLLTSLLRVERNTVFEMRQRAFEQQLYTINNRLDMRFSKLEDKLDGLKKLVETNALYTPPASQNTNGKQSIKTEDPLHMEKILSHRIIFEARKPDEVIEKFGQIIVNSNEAFHLRRSLGK